MRDALKTLALVVGLLLSGCTTSTPRDYLSESPIVISEIHFYPSLDQGDDEAEFVEIANISRQPVDLSGWELTGPGRVRLPEGTVLQPGGTVVVCRNMAVVRRNFGESLPIAATSPGKLKNRKGEPLRVEDRTGRVAVEVEYDPTSPEGQKAAGTGQSLHWAGYTASSGHLWIAGSPNPGKVPATRR